MKKHLIQPEYDYYHILGLEPTATHAEIRSAFRALALRHHPDQNPNDPQAEEKFRIVTEAYKVVGSSRTRANYDRARNASQNQRNRTSNYSHRRESDDAQPARSAGRKKSGAAHAASTTDTEGKGAAKPWWQEDEEPLSSQPSPPPPPPPPRPETVDGTDIEVDVTITEEVARFGSKQPLAVSRLENCTVCGGTGGRPGTAVRRCPECDPQTPSPTCRICAGRGSLIEAACTSCFGRGKSRITKTRVINVPPRTHTGQTIRIPGEGTPPRGEGKPGDLVIRFLVKRRDEYEQRDAAVYSEIHVTPQMAAMGGIVRVKTVDGSADVFIPPGTKPGAVFRLEGKGPILQGKERGDHFVTVRVVVP